MLIGLGVACLADLTAINCSPWGISVAVLSALFYTAYILSTNQITLPPLTNTLFVSLGSAMSAGLLAVYSQTATWPNFYEQWLYLIGLGIFSTALPILLFLRSLQYISLTQASILSVLEPLCVLLVGVFILKEPISLFQMLGSSLMLAGALLSLYKNS